MRLNFAGNSEEVIREGIRRIGSAVRTQVGMISTLTGSRAGAADEKRAPREDAAALADVVELPRRGARASARRHRDG